MSSAAIQREKQVNATTAEFPVNFQMATSEGSEGPWLLKVIVKKFDDQWLITDYGDATDSKEQPLSFNKPNQKLQPKRKSVIGISLMVEGCRMTR